MADFWCFLWMFSKDFSPGDGIRIVTAMTPNGSLDPWKFIVRHVNRHSFPSPRSLKWQDASLGIFTSKSIQNPAKSSKNLQQKIPRWRCFFGWFFTLPKNVCCSSLSWFFSHSEFSGHGLVAPLPAHLSRGGLGLTPQAPAPTAPTAPAAADPVTLGNVGKLR